MQTNYGYGPSLDSTISYDARAFLSKVFLIMAAGLGITGFFALILSNMPHVMAQVFGTPLKYVFLFAPLGISLYINARFHSIHISTLHNLFWLYCMLMGVSMSSIFLIYTGESIARTFFVSAAVFLSAAIYGKNTKKDLSYMGMFMFMGLVGIMIASIVGFFFQSQALEFVISVIGVIVFTGLTAYNVQNLLYIQGRYSGEDSSKIAIIGALSLYINFINLFLFLLRFLGNRRNN